MKVSPDVLILPSKLAPFCRPVLNTMVINAGSLAKGSNGGTYAEMAIHPIRESDLRDRILAGKQTVPASEFPIGDRVATCIKKI